MRVQGRRSVFHKARLIVGFLAVLFLLLGPALLVSATEAATTAQEESPYTPPEFDDAEVPSWLAPLEPLAQLPLWGQAAVLSAGVAGMFFLVPLVFRWVWKLGEDRKNGNGHDADLTLNGKHEDRK